MITYSIGIFICFVLVVLHTKNEFVNMYETMIKFIADAKRSAIDVFISNDKVVRDLHVRTLRLEDKISKQEKAIQKLIDKLNE